MKWRVTVWRWVGQVVLAVVFVFVALMLGTLASMVGWALFGEAGETGAFGLVFYGLLAWGAWEEWSWWRRRRAPRDDRHAGGGGSSPDILASRRDWERAWDERRRGR